MKEIEDFTNRIKEKIKSFAQEAKKNHMMVGNDGFIVPNYCFYKPHNYRLYFTFKKTNFNQKNQGGEGWFLQGGINSKEHILKTELFTIRVKKTQIEIINKGNEWFRVPINKDTEDEIISITRKKDEECKDILKEFINIYGGETDYIILNRHSEDKIKGEDSIDLIPIKQKFHNKVVKKVYNENNIEFSNPAFAINYLNNRAIENISPQIANALRYSNPLRVLKSLCSLEEIYQHMDLVALLYDTEKKELNDWIWDKFAIKGE